MSKVLDTCIKARTYLIMEKPFWGMLSTRLKIIEATDIISYTKEGPMAMENPTACTDGVHIFVNPNYIGNLNFRETVGLMAHEVGHCAFGHIWRGEGRAHEKWNIATDYVLNGNLKAVGLTLPKGCLLDPQFDSMSAEEVYAKIPPQPKGKGGGSNADPGKCGGVIHPKMGKAEQDEMKARWKAATAAAARQCQGRGDVPAGLDIELQKMTDPPLPWHALLRDFLDRTARNDYDWTRVNRRYITRDIVLPSLYSEELPGIILADDTSGSTMGYQRAFAAQFSHVLQAFNTEITVLYCDAQVYQEETFRREDLPLELHPKGGGGTDFRPVFEHVETKGMQPCAMVFFTDGYGVWPDKAPEYPVLWIVPHKCQSKEQFPFGEYIEYRNEEGQ